MKTIQEMAREARFIRQKHNLISNPMQHRFSYECYEEELEAFAALVREDAIAEANAKANASWTLMCEKMVAIEREECAKFLLQGVDLAGLAQDPMLTKYTVELLSGCANSIRARNNT